MRQKQPSGTLTLDYIWICSPDIVQHHLTDVITKLVASKNKILINISEHDYIRAPSTCGHSTFNFVIYDQISSKFHIWVASINLWFKFEYGFCPTNDNQDGQQNGHCLSVCSCGHSTLVIYYLIASKFHIWITFIKLAQVRIWAL